MVDAWAIALLVFAVTVLALIGVAVALVVWNLTRRNCLAPGFESGAPLSWLWSPAEPARLHRRLRLAVGPLPAAPRKPSAAASTASPLVELAQAVTHEALATDRELVLVARTPRARRRVELRRLRADVRELEELSRRVQHVGARAASGARGMAPPSRREVFDDVSHRLDALSEAHDELMALERAAVVDDPEAILREIRPAPVSSGRPERRELARRPHHSRDSRDSRGGTGSIRR